MIDLLRQQCSAHRVVPTVNKPRVRRCALVYASRQENPSKNGPSPQESCNQRVPSTGMCPVLTVSRGLPRAHHDHASCYPASPPAQLMLLLPPLLLLPMYVCKCACVNVCTSGPSLLAHAQCSSAVRTLISPHPTPTPHEQLCSLPLRCSSA